MPDQTTDHLVEAVEAAAIGLAGNLQPFRWSELGEVWREKYRAMATHAVAAIDPIFAAYYEDKGRKSLIGKTDPDLWENPEAIDIALGRVYGHVEHDINCGIPNPADPDRSSRCTCGAESAVGQLDEVIGEALIAAEEKGRSEERERLREKIEKVATFDPHWRDEEMDEMDYEGMPDALKGDWLRRSDAVASLDSDQEAGNG
jgi:hypothetical protein